MRTFLFNAVTQTSAGIILVLTKVHNLSLSIVGGVGYTLMRLIDAKRLNMYEKVLEASEEGSELSAQAMELRLLASANQVRDHARETADSTH